MSKTQIPWTDEETELLRAADPDLTSDKIAHLFPRHTVLGISVKRRRLGARLSERARSDLAAYARSCVDPQNLLKLDLGMKLGELGNVCRQVLIGSVIGDGSIKRGNFGKAPNCHFYCCHVGPQIPYLYWKSELLSELLPKPTTNTNGERAELTTPSAPFLSEIRADFYDDPSRGRKGHLLEKYVEGLDELGLMIWYLDDGSLVQPRRIGGLRSTCMLSSKVFSTRDMVAAAEILNKNLGLSLSVRSGMHQTKTHPHRAGINNQLVFNRQSRLEIVPRWRALAKKHRLPEHMWSKLGDRYDITGVDRCSACGKRYVACHCE